MDMTIIAPNFTGFLAGGYYSYKFTQFDSGQFDLTPYKMGSVGAIAACTAVVATCDVSTAQQILGYSGVAVCLAMFSGPLMVIKEVTGSAWMFL